MSKETKSPDEGSAFIEAIRAVEAEHGFRITAELQATNKGIVPVLTYVRSNQPTPDSQG